MTVEVYRLKVTTYSYLSNKRGAHAYQFKKIPPSSKQTSTSTFIEILDFPPSTPRLLELCTSFFQKFHPPRLFQAPRLVILQFFYPLHVYSNIRVSDVVKSRNKRY